jgi:hypothetical protein
MGNGPGTHPAQHKLFNTMTQRAWIVVMDIVVFHGVN